MMMMMMMMMVIIFINSIRIGFIGSRVAGWDCRDGGLGFFEYCLKTFEGRRIDSREVSPSDAVNKRKCCVPFTVASFVSSNTIRGFGVVGGQPKVLTLTYIRPHINIP